MYRFRNGLTQRDLAILCGWDKEYVVRIEYGLVNMPLAHIDKLVDTLECTLEDLLTSKNIDELNRINRFKQRKRAAKGLA
jgi:predicted transcriptional regulator